MPTKKILSVLATLTIGVFGVLAVGHCHARQQRQEPVWQGNGPPAWMALLPLTVRVDPAFGAAHVASAEQAVREVNRVCPILRLVPYGEPATITIMNEGCVTSPHHAGCTFLHPEEQTVTIQVGQPGDVTQSYLVFLHELGHALGLAHDGVYPVPDDPRDALPFVSIMADNVAEHGDRLSAGLHLPMLSERDRDALSARFCGTE